MVHDYKGKDVDILSNTSGLRETLDILNLSLFVLSHGYFGYERKQVRMSIIVVGPLGKRTIDIHLYVYLIYVTAAFVWTIKATNAEIFYTFEI